MAGEARWFGCSPIKVAMFTEEWELGSKDVTTVWSLSLVIVGILRGLDRSHESPCVEHTSDEPVIVASVKAG